MRVNKNEIVKDMYFCNELMDRLVVQTKNSLNNDGSCYCGNYTIQSDIIRLRRELNEIRKKLEWDYQWKGDK